MNTNDNHATNECRTFELLLPQLTHGFLGREASLKAHAHLSTCSHCQKLLAEYNAIDAALRKTLLPHKAATFSREEIVRMSNQTQQTPHYPRDRSRSFPAIVAAIITVVIIGGLALLFNRHANLSLDNKPPVIATATIAPATVTTLMTATPLPTTNTIVTDCSVFIQNSISQIPFSIPLPAGSLVGQGKAALGTGITPVCTPNSTKAAIDNFMNSNLPKAGWRPYNASRDNNNGCGPSFNWIKDNTAAIAWDYGAFSQSGQDFGPPGWEILLCAHLTS